MQRYAGGDESAFGRLYARHKDATFRYALRQLDHAAAADCQQAIWLKLIEQRERYQPSGRFRSYLFTLAHNVITDEHRRRTASSGRFSGVDADSLASTDSPREHAEQSERHRLLLSAIAELPQAQRDAVLLKAEGGLSLAQIAEVTDSKPEAIKSRLRYALANLRKRFEVLTDEASTTP